MSAPHREDTDTTLDALLLHPEAEDLPAAIALRQQALNVEAARDVLRREVRELRRLMKEACHG